MIAAPRSLRRRLLLWIFAGGLLLTLAAGWAVQRYARVAETAEFDANLLAVAYGFATIAEQEAGEINFDWGQVSPRSLMRADPDDGTGVSFRIEDARGGVVADASHRFGGPGHPLNPDRKFPSLEDAPAVPVLLDDGTRAREVCFEFTVRPEDDQPSGGVPPTLTMHAWQRTHEMDDLIARLRGIVATCGLAAVLVGGGGLALLLNRSLAGLDPLRRQLATLAAGDVSQRVDAGSLPSEFLPLVESVNGLVADLRRQMERERRFVADAAHELRTPIATLLLNLELAAEGRSETHGPLPRCLLVVAHMQRLCERLLQLSQMQSGVVAEPSEVDLAEFVQDAVEQTRGKLQERNIGLRLETQAAATSWMADPVLLWVVLTNLLANAAAYAPESTQVRFYVAREEDRLIFEVINLVAAGVDVNCTQAFEAFWRGDGARVLAEGHAGLGLALAATATKAMGGTLGCECTDGCFVARLEVPPQGPSVATHRG